MTIKNKWYSSLFLKHIIKNVYINVFFKIEISLNVYFYTEYLRLLVYLVFLIYSLYAETIFTLHVYQTNKNNT